MVLELDGAGSGGLEVRRESVVGDVLPADRDEAWNGQEEEMRGSCV